MSTRPEHGDFDELPAHPVRISHAFRISVTEVSPAEYRLFDPTYVPGPATPAYAAGVSWQQATAYCAWLTRRRPASPGVCPPRRSGSTSPAPAARTSLAHSNTMPKVDTPNAFGAENMGVGRPEWTSDWYGPYQSGEQIDPSGAASGYTKVVRGGGLDYRKSGGTKRRQSNSDLNVPATAPYFARAGQSRQHGASIRID